jgi:hypothetical protein
VDLIDLAQDNDLWWAVVNTVMNLLVPEKGLEILDYLSDCNYPMFYKPHEVFYTYCCVDL